MVTALQQRLEAANRNRREKEEAANRSEREKEEAGEQLRGRLSQLEGAYLQAYRLSDHQDAYRKQENRVLQDLLADYETLEKDHGRVKDKLVSTEDKLFDAIAQISELKRVVSKLESQVKQLEHENLRSRHLSHSHSQPSGAGLYHHPDLLLSPSRSQADLETSSRKWTDPGQPLDQTAANTTRHYSSPEKEEIWGGPVPDELPRRETPLAPLMKALIVTEEKRSTEGGALHRPVPQGPCSSHSAARRDKLMAPPPDKSSPKRCPSENFSTAFGPAPSWRRHSHSWSDVRLDQRGLMSSSPSHSSNAKKRLQCSGEPEANHQPSNGKGGVASGEDPIEQGAEGNEAGPPRPSAAPLSLPDTERLFDQLTLEKQQIEAALSRIPNTAGGRITLQAKIEEEALEARLESVNRELGSIRMTLKKFHVLRSSANI
ncbi:hypothetical protein ANANG_G00186410 [Anguilla anguilla]|uniref:M-phase phosphoprotein 9 n=1 Tax=Anguilla anguilla TaxID=7936 RepID=A0A9D3RR57_ANGAN|nr:hypothetical protein ANANG_G00186410 [Anguilla anguilla]